MHTRNSHKIADTISAPSVSYQESTPLCFPQVANSEARQFLQPAQYYASCNRAVMPVLSVNTVPNIGILLAYYWRSTDYYYWQNTKIGAVPTFRTVLI